MFLCWALTELSWHIQSIAIHQLQTKWRVRNKVELHQIQKNDKWSLAKQSFIQKEASGLQNPVEHLQWSFFTKAVKAFNCRCIVNVRLGSKYAFGQGRIYWEHEECIMTKQALNRLPAGRKWIMFEVWYNHSLKRPSFCK